MPSGGAWSSGSRSASAAVVSPLQDHCEVKPCQRQLTGSGEYGRDRAELAGGLRLQHGCSADEESQWPSSDWQQSLWRYCLPVAAVPCAAMPVLGRTPAAASTVRRISTTGGSILRGRWTPVREHRRAEAAPAPVDRGWERRDQRTGLTRAPPRQRCGEQSADQVDGADRIWRTAVPLWA